MSGYLIKRFGLLAEQPCGLTRGLWLLKSSCNTPCSGTLLQQRQSMLPSGDSPARSSTWRFQLPRQCIADANSSWPAMLTSIGHPNPPETTGNSELELEFVCFDTWPLSYERDGIDQDGDGTTDQGFDGIDHAVQGGTQNGIDDINERETSPPYNVAPKGIEVRIRMLEFGTGQVRQASVVGDFTD